jgi:BirA family transcriptional regulator, biotin operon repressor / biotin---[acetyl-CoA-carboxylase] ligase
MLTLPDRPFRYFPSIGSTMDAARAWAEAGAPDGAVVAADEQTSGRGRLQRRWVTRPGSALAFSIVLRPTLAELPHLALLSPLGGLAVCTALENTLGLAPQIKWPNDVLLARHKTCGILAEAFWQGPQLEAVILGIGINIAPGSVPPLQELLFPATCVEDFTHQPVERNALLAAILDRLDAWRAQLGSPAFMDAWQARLAFRGEPVEIQFPANPALVGRLQGVDTDGNLRIALESGEMVSVAAGDVRLRPAAPEGDPHV